MARCWLGLLFALFLWQVPVAEELAWQQTLTKMTTSDGYSMNYDYQGPEGKFFFRYTVQGNDEKILTEVLPGSARGEGTRVYYEPAKDKDNVFMETRFLTLRRSLEARDIKDSSLYQSLFRQIVGELPQTTPTEVLPFGQGKIYLFGEAAKVQGRVEVDERGYPVSYRRLEGGREVKKLTFRNISWGFHPIEWKD